MQTQQIEFPTYINQVKFLNRIAGKLVALTKKYINRPVLNELEKMERDARAGAVFLLNFEQTNTSDLAMHAACNADLKRPLKRVIMEGQYFTSHQTSEAKEIAGKSVFHFS
jgi:hypothetical protein